MNAHNPRVTVFASLAIGALAIISMCAVYLHQHAAYSAWN